MASKKKKPKSKIPSSAPIVAAASPQGGGGDAYAITRMPDAAARGVPGLSICAIRAFRPNETIARESGTAWVWSPRRVVTAAHVVFSRAGAFGTPVAKAARLEILPSVHRPTFGPLATLGFSNIIVHPKFEDGTDPSFDIAVIELDVDLPAQCAPLNMLSMSDTELQVARVDVVGYPLRVDVKQINPRGEQLFMSEGPVTRALPLAFGYDTYVYGGQSGAPIFKSEQPGTNNGQVIGIHLAGAKDADAMGNGLRITSEIEKWIREL